MKLAFNPLAFNDIIFSLSVGFILSLIYLYLLWQTIQIIRKSSRPILILFISGTARIFLLVFTALLFAQNDLGKFLLIFCAFFLTRVAVLNLMKPAFKTAVKENEFAYHDTKISTTKSTKKRKTRK